MAGRWPSRGPAASSCRTSNGGRVVLVRTGEVLKVEFAADSRTGRDRLRGRHDRRGRHGSGPGGRPIQRRLLAVTHRAAARREAAGDRRRSAATPGWRSGTSSRRRKAATLRPTERRPALALAWSPDGRRLGIGLELASTAEIWDVDESARWPPSRGTRRRSACWRFHPGGNLVLIALVGRIGPALGRGDGPVGRPLAEPHQRPPLRPGRQGGRRRDARRREAAARGRAGVGSTARSSSAWGSGEASLPRGYRRPTTCWPSAWATGSGSGTWTTGGSWPSCRSAGPTRSNFVAGKRRPRAADLRLRRATSLADRRGRRGAGPAADRAPAGRSACRSPRRSRPSARRPGRAVVVTSGRARRSSWTWRPRRCGAPGAAPLAERRLHSARTAGGRPRGGWHTPESSRSGTPGPAPWPGSCRWAVTNTAFFSPDGRTLVTSLSGRYRFWECRRGGRSEELPGRSLLSRLGRLLARRQARGAGALAGGRPSPRCRIGRTWPGWRIPDSDRARWLGFTADGGRLVTIAPFSKAIHVWDLAAIAPAARRRRAARGIAVVPPRPRGLPRGRSRWRSSANVRVRASRVERRSRHDDRLVSTAPWRRTRTMRSSAIAWPGPTSPHRRLCATRPGAGDGARRPCGPSRRIRDTAIPWAWPITARAGIARRSTCSARTSKARRIASSPGTSASWR